MREMRLLSFTTKGKSGQNGQLAFKLAVFFITFALKPQPSAP